MNERMTLLAVFKFVICTIQSTKALWINVFHWQISGKQCGVRIFLLTLHSRRFYRDFLSNRLFIVPLQALK